MAKLAKTKPPKYYVFYERQTGKILGAGQEKSDRYETGIEVTFDEVKNLIDGTWSFRDYRVGYKNDINGKPKLTVVPNTELGYTFKNNIFEWITEKTTKVDCQVSWNGPEKCWEFSITNEAKDQYINKVIIPKLIFFVTLESDFDFLIRTIVISSDLLTSSKKVVIPFETDIETKIDKISISSKLVFRTYGLKVIRE